MRIAERHARHYMAYAYEHRDDWDWFDDEWGQILRAWEWVKHQDASLAVIFIRIFESFLDRRSLWLDEIAWAQEGARLAEETDDHRQRSVFLNYLGITYANVG